MEIVRNAGPDHWNEVAMPAVNRLQFGLKFPLDGIVRHLKSTASADDVTGMSV